MRTSVVRRVLLVPPFLLALAASLHPQQPTMSPPPFLQVVQADPLRDLEQPGLEAAAGARAVFVRVQPVQNVSFRWADGWSLSIWSRNLLDKNYLELLSAAPGNSGLYVGQPGDGRTVGLTLRVALRSR